MYQEIEGDLIKLAIEGNFDVITHGCNCHCVMGAGIAPQMAKAFGCDKFPLEGKEYSGDVRKLGAIDFKFLFPSEKHTKGLYVVNSYTQFTFGRNHEGGIPIPLDYEALTLCLRKINHIFKGKKIGLPQIGCGLAGGDWNKVKQIIQNELIDCETTVVIFKKQ